MLSDAMVLEIRRLLDEGELSARAISRQLGVSRGSVANVASGLRGLRSLPAVDEKHDVDATRCRQCGGMVYRPCRLCRTRQFQQRLRELRTKSVGNEPNPRRVAS